MNKKAAAVFLAAACLIFSACSFNREIDEIPNSESESVTADTLTSEPAETEASERTTEDTSESSSASTTEASTKKTVTSAAEQTTTSETETEAETEPVTVQTTTTATAAATTVITTTAAPETTAATTVTTTTTAASVTQPAEPSEPTIYPTRADGTLVFANSLATIDYSNTSDGYIMAKYTGSVSKIKLQVKGPNGVTQTYTLSSSGEYAVIPLTGGNGTYSIAVYENVSGNQYATANSGQCSVTLSSATAPYLRTNQNVNFSYGDAAVTKASQLCGGTTTALEKVDRIYSWIVDNVVYDYSLASSVTGGYIPDIDKVINQKKGICYDYAAAMAAMLRSQNVPVQLAVGYAGSEYHAWVNVYVTDVGWVYGIIYFDGSAWHRMDPTFAAGSASGSAIMDFIANDGNYSIQYLY